LQLREGAARVLGPAQFAPRQVVAGERLEVELGRAPHSSQPAQPVPQVTALAAPPSAPAQTPAARPVSTWRKLAAAGAYREAFRALSREGVEPLLRGGSAADLAQAADVARFAGRPAQARMALIALRARFPSTAPAADAAFALGRLVFGESSSALEAARWFEVYRQEQPRGAFTREVAGRLIECHVQLQHAEHAARAAREYLELFPDGPHAALARSVLDGPSPHAP
jgi:TolA-binding protein